MAKAGRMIGWSVAVALLIGLLAGGYWMYTINNIETPAYTVVKADKQGGAIEIRDYPAMVVAEVTTKGDRRAAVSAGFGPLAGYIFAKERPQGGAQGTIPMTAPVTQSRATIAMTAPVTQSATNDQGDWVVRFVMPSKYTLQTLPVPAGAAVRLNTVPAQRRAVIRFSGRATDASVAEQEALLRSWMAANGLTVIGSATYAYYNPPFYPPPLMRNEVMFDVTK
jgi:effector-binding domain-containing protein